VDVNSYRRDQDVDALIAGCGALCVGGVRFCTGLGRSGHDGVVGPEHPGNLPVPGEDPDAVAVARFRRLLAAPPG